jgi:hypothetical protein
MPVTRTFDDVERVRRGSVVPEPLPSQTVPMSAAWIPKSSQSLRSVTRMLDDVEERRTTSLTSVPVKPVPDPPKFGDELPGRSAKVDRPFEITEAIMLSLLEDETFEKEVIAIARLWDKLGINRRLFSVDL